jgi:GT2 family glycosyltransferase
MVSATIVTWNSAQYLEECFAALAILDYRDVEVIIVDNASEDGTRALLKTVESKWRVLYNDKNVGFAAGQNQAIRAARGEWILCLNPDVVLSPDFITQMVAAGEAHPDAGSLCGKLLRLWPQNRDRPEMQDAGHHPGKTEVIDSTGIYFTPNMRHLDRGAEAIDRGQYNRAQYVFGASGAAAFFRRDVIDDVSVEGEFFDEEFFAFREDGDLAWRAQLMGWKCLYTPRAVAWHVRRVTPERRKDLPLVINWHSAKNRFLMRGKNASAWLCWRLFFPVLWRDIMTFGYAAVRDRRLWSAVTYWCKAWGSIRRKRAIIQARRRVTDRDLLWWFSNTPRAMDAE